MSTPENDNKLLKKLIIEALSTNSATNVVDFILKTAVRYGASDIHLIPQERSFKVAFRISGQFQIWNEIDIPEKDLGGGKTNIWNRIVGRLNTISNANLDNRSPKDSSYQLKIIKKIKTKDGQIKQVPKIIMMRLNFLPCIYGVYKVAIRIFSQKKISLEDMKFDKKKYNTLKSASKGDGLILISGPTGSGKTTLLHAILDKINPDEKHIITVEDPVEQRKQGIIHSQINNNAGYTFEQANKAILRQDPDVVMFGEIRDKETADIAAKLGATGHLVYATIHADNSMAIPAKLCQLGVEPTFVSQALRMLISQVLMPKLCSKCKIKEELTTPLETLMKNKIGELLKKNNMEIPKFHYKVNKKGCESCKFGIETVIPVTEVFMKDEGVSFIINEKKASPNDIRRHLVDNKGFITMEQEALLKVAQGDIALTNYLDKFIA